MKADERHRCGQADVDEENFSSQIAAFTATTGGMPRAIDPMIWSWIDVGLLGRC
jgi:hypothetical protein